MNASYTTINDLSSCIILGLNTTIPWDNPYNIISLESVLIIDRVKAAICIPLLYLIGAPANMVNMAVFFKQGLKERINLCLFSLALVDLIYLTLLFTFYAERIYTQFTTGEQYGEVYRYMMNNNVIGLYGFGYGPTLLAAIISTERCVCVLFPLQAHRCIPTKVLAFMIVSGVCVLGITRFAITAQYQVTCFYEMKTGRRSWQVFVNDYHFQNKEMLKVLDGIFYGFCVSVGCPVIVLITTVLTAVKLQQTIRWRHLTSSSMSIKEIGVTKMLICLSIEFFVLSIPVISLRVLPIFEPKLSAAGYYANLFVTLLGFSELCSYTSSSVNFFVYFFTGSRYRETLNSLFAQITTLKK
ncbi:hypothetical protein ACOMHN_061960 [Nucella lapillus]